MKVVLCTLVLAGSLMALAPGEARAWYCRADGTTGAWGWATRYWRSEAVRAALWQCSIRTPRWGRCYISYCN